MESITIEDFAKADLRVGEIKSAEKVEWSEKLIKLQVDFGSSGEELGIKQVLSGILKWYQPEELVGKKAIFIVNLPEKQIKDLVSQAMILTAFNQEKDLVSIIVIDKAIDNGTKIE